MTEEREVVSGEGQKKRVTDKKKDRKKRQEDVRNLQRV